MLERFVSLRLFKRQRPFLLRRCPDFGSFLVGHIEQPWILHLLACEMQKLGKILPADEVSSAPEPDRIV